MTSNKNKKIYMQKFPNNLDSSTKNAIKDIMELEEIKEEKKKKIEQEENFLAEINNALIIEAVNHFTAFRPRNYDDDSRFFYNRHELNAFYLAYDKAGGDRRSLMQEVVFDDNNEFFCWEVKRDRKYIAEMRAKTLKG